ncbi:tRNA dihydrouridine synthase [Breznakiella homolactica]|nr:tRNA-dihydrouridine synthase family protein [Breznakiella homolactica]
MAELSHRPLRELIHSFGGCDEYYTEMISAPALLSGGEFESYYIDGLPDPGKTVYQLVGANPEQLAAAAAALSGKECAGIDINMGCAAPAITRTGAGAAWMNSADAAARMIEGVRKATDRRLSVKLRIGPSDDYEYLLGFCRALESAGVERITLHPRTVKEKFRRRARWEYVARLGNDLSVPVAGNGDIADAADLAEKAGGPWAAVMAGRGAVRFPWIFARARMLEGGESRKQNFLGDSIDLAETAARFLDLLVRYQPREFHLSRARRFFAYFCDNLTWAHYVKTLIGREPDISGIAAVLAGYFRDHPEERYISLNSGPS